MVNDNILSLPSDEMSLIFNFLIFGIRDFNTFSKFLMAWVTKQTTHRIKDVLEKLEWDSLYRFHRHDYEATRYQFSGFIGFAVKNKVQQAMFYNSVDNLFRKHGVQHNLNVLSQLAGNHFPSSFCFLFFKAIYRPFDVMKTYEEMYSFFKTSHMRNNLLQLMRLLEDRYSYISNKQKLLPIYKLCPNARNPDPMYQIDGLPYPDELWDALCDKTVDGNYRHDGEIWGKQLKMKHLWETKCVHCKLQLILFKILLCSVQDIEYYDW